MEGRDDTAMTHHGEKAVEGWGVLTCLLPHQVQVSLPSCPSPTPTLPCALATALTGLGRDTALAVTRALP